MFSVDLDTTSVRRLLLVLKSALSMDLKIKKIEIFDGERSEKGRIMRAEYLEAISNGKIQMAKALFPVILVFGLWVCQYKLDATPDQIEVKLFFFSLRKDWVVCRLFQELFSNSSSQRRSTSACSCSITC